MSGGVEVEIAAVEDFVGYLLQDLDVRDLILKDSLRNLPSRNHNNNLVSPVARA